MEIKIIFSKRKSLGLQVSPKGVFVRAPLRTPIKYINQLLEERKIWIQDKVDLLDRRKSEVNKEFLNTDKEIWLFGEVCRVESYASQKSPYLGGGNEVDGGSFCSKKEGIPDQVRNDGVFIEHSNFDLIKFYKDQLEKYLGNKLDSFADLVGVGYEEYKVKKLKSKWGSCSAKGHLVFNSYLAKCPEYVIDYVIIHELCHRLEMNHAKRFWDLVTRFCPEWKSVKKWFKVYGRNVLEG